METEVSVKEKSGNFDVVVQIQSPGKEKNQENGERIQENGGSGSKEEFQTEENSLQMKMNLFTQAQAPAPSPAPAPAAQLIIQSPDLRPSSKPPLGPAMRRRSLTSSAYSKPKSRIAEPPYPSKKAEPSPQAGTKSPLISSPNVGSPSFRPNAGSTPPKTSAPITPRTPLMSSVDDDDDDDEDVYKAESLKPNKEKKGKKKKMIVVFEWVAFVCIMAVLIASLTIVKLKKDTKIWSLELWKWCVLVLVIFCGRLITEWFTNFLVFLIERNFILKKKVLYFIFGLKKSVRVVIWLGLILMAWALLINRGVKREEDTSKTLNYITRGIVSTLVGAVLWMVKTFLVKLVASSFHVKTFFDRIQESIFHQYILQALSGSPMMYDADGNANDGLRANSQLSFRKTGVGKEEKKGEVINVDKLYKIKREKVSAWTMGRLIKVIRNSELPTISEVLDESIEEESEEPQVISSEIEARIAANRIFKKVAKHGHKYIDEDDLLQYMPKEEVDNAFPLFEGATETRRIKKSSFRNWVLKAYNERKCLAVSLKDAKTAIEELNKLASGFILVVIAIVWILMMEIASTKVLVFISSQLLLVVFMFGNTAKMVFEAIIFVFVVHPFDVGDRCVIDGIQMVVDEMNILTTIFLKPDNEKVYYPNSVLATKPISNFNRSPEMMGDTVEFAVDFATSTESLAALRAKIKGYLESKPQHWNPNHSVQLREIVDVNKMIMALYVTHTINFQNTDRGNRRSDLVFELKRILEEIGIKYRLLPQEVQISYVGGAMPTPSRI